MKTSDYVRPRASDFIARRSSKKPARNAAEHSFLATGTEKGTAIALKRPFYY
jgi:hypothetical protein